MVAAVTGAILGTATAVDIHFNMFLQVMGVLQTVVLGPAVGDEPCYFLGLVGCKVCCDRLPPHFIVEVNPFFVGSHQLAVRLVGRRPIENVLLSDVLSMQRTLQHVHDPYLMSGSFMTGGREEICCQGIKHKVLLVIHSR